MLGKYTLWCRCTLLIKVNIHQIDRVPKPGKMHVWWVKLLHIVVNFRGSATPTKMGGTGTRRQRSQDFLQRVTHTKARKLSGFGALFS